MKPHAGRVPPALVPALALSLGLALVLAGCAAMRAPPATSSAPSSSGSAPGALHTPAQLLAGVQHIADQMDAEKDAAARHRLMGQAIYLADSCLQQAPQDGTCHYAHGIVLGMEARENPVKAASILKDMLASLARAEALSPKVDHGGPARLQAIVLLRAPPWPLGPGDASSALDAAKRAVAVDPDFKPNQDVLKEAEKESPR